MTNLDEYLKNTAENNGDTTSKEATVEASSVSDGDGFAESAIEDMTRGMIYASLAITDNKENTLEKVSITPFSFFSFRVYPSQSLTKNDVMPTCRSEKRIHGKLKPSNSLQVPRKLHTSLWRKS